MFTTRLRRIVATGLTAALWTASFVGPAANLARSAEPGAIPSSVSPQTVVHRVQAANERMEMIVNSSRILTLDQKIPKAQVNNPDVLTLTPISPTQIQVSAKKTGVTQVNLWNEDDQVFTVDVVVYGDAQELTMYLRSQFPRASLKVLPLPNSVIISGYVDDPREVSLITEIAADFYPKVINNITVGGVQQVLLFVKVIEVSRTKLRTLGVDFANLTSNGSFVASGVDGVLKMASVPAHTVTSTGGETFSFGVIEPGNSFFGFLEALRQDNLSKILAEPTLVTISGRPAYFNVGGEFPILVPQSLGTVSIQYRPYGTQVDFVPIVLGNGGIRLEVRPRVSEIDDTRSVVINNVNVPALLVREIDTGVEMRPGQTLAIAGLVQNRVDATKRGVPFLGDMPYIGALFSKKTDQINEVELLVMVTPQIVEAMDPHEVPTCGPGMDTTNPTDVQLYLKNMIEVPLLCAPGAPGTGPGPGPGPGGPGGPVGIAPPSAAVGPGGPPAWTPLQMQPSEAVPVPVPSPPGPPPSVVPPVPAVSPEASNESSASKFKQYIKQRINPPASKQPDSFPAKYAPAIEQPISPPSDPAVDATPAGSDIPPAPVATPERSTGPQVRQIKQQARPNVLRESPAPQQGVRIVPMPVTPTRPMGEVSYNQPKPYNPPAATNSPRRVAKKPPANSGFIGPVGYDVLK
jgi:pilus assembly protein CpaC